MTTKITKEFLQEHFKKHDSITLYKPDGTPVTISKQYNIVLQGGYSKFTFKDCAELIDFHRKHPLCLKPTITII